MKKQIKNLPHGTIIKVYQNLYKVSISQMEIGWQKKTVEILPVKEGKGFRRFIDKDREVEVVEMGESKIKD